MVALSCVHFLVWNFFGWFGSCVKKDDAVPMTTESASSCSRFIRIFIWLGLLH